MAELIGSTRSTVTRQISQLRQQGLLSIDPGGEALLLTPELVE
ncbi:MAG: helix-turn-helix domain-containing protein, partial [Prochlorococcaceae cyanobacterium]